MPLTPAEAEILDKACIARDLAKIVNILKSRKGSYQSLDPVYIALCEAEPIAAILLIKDRINQGKMTADFINKLLTLKREPELELAPLHLACMINDVELVDLLLSIKGIKVNLKTTSGANALSGIDALGFAATYGFEDVTKRLLAVDGIEPDQCEDTGFTPVSLAFVNGFPSIAKLLLNTGRINVNRVLMHPNPQMSKTIPYFSALMYALCGGLEEGRPADLETFKLLIRQGANLMINGVNILDITVPHQNLDKEVVPYLKRIEALRAAQGYVHEQRPELFKAKKELFDAIDSASKDKVAALAKVKQLIQKYPELLSALDEHNDAPKEGDSPLHRACRVGCREIVEALITAGDNVNRTKVGSNVTALHIAAQEGFADITRFLISRGAQIDIENVFKATPLLAACDKKKVEAARALIDAGAIVDQLNDKGRSCLDIAEKCPEIAAMLKAKGAHTSAELKALSNGSQPAATSTQPASAASKPLPATPKSPAVIAASSGFLGAGVAVNGKANGQGNQSSGISAAMPTPVPVASVQSKERAGNMHAFLGNKSNSSPMHIPISGSQTNGAAGLGYQPPSPPKVV